MRIPRFATTSVLAAALAAGGLVAASPAEAAPVASAGKVTASASSNVADRTFIQMMTSRQNPDRAIYAGQSSRRMRDIGVYVCGRVKAYNQSQPAKAAIVSTLREIQAADAYPYTDAGDAFLVVASITSYCTKYKKALG
ncbi:hypothetical protein KOI35_16045 [Actinoplanes bogorensis]|uniref:DUF732 domain-containing protein n=1 Tax=Paractinoplanes bogorensis TaxID=1610840 RepID=A0ABS5YPM2_9ACTN|nr:hypothetical protein [Actinoplanes bogorensis]MBU2665016.1 hypothetical protein [Actinoplanes bogorensis]